MCRSSRRCRRIIGLKRPGCVCLVLCACLYEWVAASSGWLAGWLAGWLLAAGCCNLHYVGLCARLSVPEGIRWTSRPGQPVRVQWAALAHGFCWSARYRGFVFCVCAAFCRECVGGRRRRRKETPKFSLGLIFFLSLSLPSLICRRKNSVRQSNKQLAIISRKGKKQFDWIFLEFWFPRTPTKSVGPFLLSVFFFLLFISAFPYFLLLFLSHRRVCCVA